MSPQLTGRPLGFAFTLAFRIDRFLFGVCDCTGVAELLGAPQRPGADAVQQFGLRRLQRNEPTKDMQQIQQVSRVLRLPGRRLD